MKTRDIDEFTGRAVGFRGIVNDRAGITHDSGNLLSEICNTHIAAYADIYDIGIGIMFQDEHARISEIIDEYELASRISRSPDDNVRRACKLCLVKSSDQG